MCINKDGQCIFCGRDYSEKFTTGMTCESDDCPSHDDLVAAFSPTSTQPMQVFCVEPCGDVYQAVFPESLSQWGCHFTDHASCKAYIKHTVDGLELWQALHNVQFSNDEKLEVAFSDFSIGTDRYDIWQWFEKTYQASIFNDFMPHNLTKIIRYNGYIPEVA